MQADGQRRRWAIAAVAVAAVGALWFLRARRRSKAMLPKLAPLPLGLDLRQTFLTLPECGDPASLRLLQANCEAWVERWRLLGSAKRSIDVSYFILHDDVYGLSFLGHLLERARSGVAVRILVDAGGTRMSRLLLTNGFLEEAAGTANVSVRVYRPLWRRWAEGLLTLQPAALVASEHDKILVVDGNRSMIGGRNIAREYFADPDENPDAFKDTDLRIESERVAFALTRAFTNQFESDESIAVSGGACDPQQSQLAKAYRAMDGWLRGEEPVVEDGEGEWPQQLCACKELRGALHQPSKAPIRAETRILDSQSRFNEPNDEITRSLGRLIQAAQHEVVVQTPYVILSREGVRLLEDAAKRGVAITILTNSPVSSDNAMSQAFLLEQWPEVLARVPTLRLFVSGRQNTLHSKAATFDGQLALVGTYNLDPVSMAFNSEVMAAAWSRELCVEVDGPVRRAIARGAPEVYEYRIERDADGNAVRAEDGCVAVAFGAGDHCEPQEWTALGAYWACLKAARDFAGFSPIL